MCPLAVRAQTTVGSGCGACCPVAVDDDGRPPSRDIGVFIGPPKWGGRDRPSGMGGKAVVEVGGRFKGKKEECWYC